MKAQNLFRSKVRKEPRTPISPSGDSSPSAVVSPTKPKKNWGALRHAVRQEKGQQYQTDSLDVLKDDDLPGQGERRGSNASGGSAAMGVYGHNSKSRIGSNGAMMGSIFKAERRSLMGARLDDLRTLVRETENNGIDPESRFVPVWVTAVSIAIVYQVTVVPFRWAFLGASRIENAGDLLIFVGDLLFVIDIFVKTRLGFVHDGNKILNRDLIWRHYVMSWEFPLDVIAAIPWEVVPWIMGASIAMARIPKLLRFVYIPARLGELESVRQVSTTFVRLLRTLVYLLIVSHSAACIWFYIGVSQGFGATAFGPGAELESKDTLSQYLAALYFAQGAVTGLVEIDQPSTTLEHLFSSLMMFMGVFVVAYLIASVNGIMSEVDVNKVKFRATLHKVNHFMKYHKMPETLHQRIINYQRFMFAEYNGFDEQDILRHLPNTLQSDIASYLTREIMNHVYLLRGAEPGFMSAVVTLLRPWLVASGDYVATIFQPVSEMYFVHWGVLEEEVEVRVSHTKEMEVLITRVLKARDYIGDYELLTGGKFAASYRAASFSHLYVLTKSVLDRVLDHYPNTLKAMQLNAKKAHRQLAVQEKKAFRRASLAMGAITRVSEGDKKKTKVSTAAEKTRKRRRRASLQTAPSSGSVADAADGAGSGELSPRRDTASAANGRKRRSGIRKSILAVAKSGRTTNSGKHAASVEGLSTTPDFWMLVTCGLSETMAAGLCRRRLAGRCCCRTRVADAWAFDEKWAEGRRVIHPDGAFWRYWQWFMQIIVLYNALLLPVRVAFAWSLAHPALLIADYATDAMCLYDIFFNMRLAFPHRGQLVISRKEIRARYRESNRVIVDVLASLPLDFMMLHLGMNPMLRINKLLRISQLPAWFDDVTKRSSRYGFLRLAKMIVVLVFAVHFISCAYFSFTFLEGYSEEATTWLPHKSMETAPITAQYARAVYFTLKPRGFGRDLGPESNLQTVFGMVVMMVGVYMFAFLIGNIGALMSSLDVNAAAFRRRVYVVERYMQSRHLPVQLQERVQAFFAVWWASHEGVEPDDVTRDLPPALQTQVMYAMCAENVRRVPFFADCNLSFVTTLCKRLRMEVVPAGEVIIRKDDIGDRMYFVSTGAVDILEGGFVADDEEEEELTPYKTIGPGSFFGEGAFFHGRRAATIRARTAVELFVLTHDALEEVVKPYPSLVVRLELLANRRRAKLNRKRENVRTFANALKGGLFQGDDNKRKAGATLVGLLGGPRRPQIVAYPDLPADEKVEPGAEVPELVTDKVKKPAVNMQSVFQVALANHRLRGWIKNRREKKRETQQKVSNTVATIQAMMAIRRAVKRKRQQKRAAAAAVKDEAASSVAGSVPSPKRSFVNRKQRPAHKLSGAGLMGVSRAAGKFKAVRARRASKLMPTEGEVATLLVQGGHAADDEQDITHVEQLLESPFAFGAKELLELMKVERKVAKRGGVDGAGDGPASAPKFGLSGSKGAGAGAGRNIKTLPPIERTDERDAKRVSDGSAASRAAGAAAASATAGRPPRGSGEVKVSSRLAKRRSKGAASDGEDSDSDDEPVTTVDPEADLAAAAAATLDRRRKRGGAGVLPQTADGGDGLLEDMESEDARELAKAAKESLARRKSPVKAPTGAVKTFVSADSGGPEGAGESKQAPLPSMVPRVEVTAETRFEGASSSALDSPTSVGASSGGGARAGAGAGAAAAAGDAPAALLRPKSSLRLDGLDLNKEFASHLDLLELVELDQASGGAMLHLPAIGERTTAPEMTPAAHTLTAASESYADRIEQALAADDLLADDELENMLLAASERVLEAEETEMQHRDTIEKRLPKDPTKRKLMEDLAESLLMAKIAGFDDGNVLHAPDGDPLMTGRALGSRRHMKAASFRGRARSGSRDDTALAHTHPQGATRGKATPRRSNSLDRMIESEMGDV